MEKFDRITLDPDVMGGKPCVRDTRVTVGTIVGLIAADHGVQEVLNAYPYLTKEDVQAALSYTAKGGELTIHARDGKVRDRRVYESES